MRKIVLRLAAYTFFLASGAAFAEGNVHFVVPTDGATVPRTFTVEMGVTGMSVEPAGELKEGRGHHHLIVDGNAIATGETVPADERHIHFGKGQTETTLTLTPGAHTLSLQFADGLHRSYGPGMSSTITVQIE